MKINYLIIFKVFIFFIGCNSNHVKNNSRNNAETTVNIQPKTIEQFENNSNYFTVEIDINEDGVKDKIVSNERHEGNELYFFQKENNEYQLVVESINFSEDGGRIIDEISPIANEGKEILKIHTYFPAGGKAQADYFVSFEKNNWILSRIIFEIGDWKNDYTKTYSCEVHQNIILNELTSEQGINKLRHLPQESKRDELCDLIYYFENSLDEFIKRFEKDNPNIYNGIGRYESLLSKYQMSNENIKQYNDIAYYLEQAKLYNESIFLLEKIIKTFPERTVAYINLADAYNGLENTEKAKENYKKYVELMKTDNKKDKIPQRVWDNMK